MRKNVAKTAQKRIKIQKSGIYICICHFFLVFLHAKMCKGVKTKWQYEKNRKHINP